MEAVYLPALCGPSLCFVANMISWFCQKLLIFTTFAVPRLCSIRHKSSGWAAVEDKCHNTEFIHLFKLDLVRWPLPISLTLVTKMTQTKNVPNEPSEENVFHLFLFSRMIAAA